MTAIGSWPEGRLEVGESAAQAVIREVAEEAGVTIALIGLSGVYSDPSYVWSLPDEAGPAGGMGRTDRRVA